MLSYIQKRLWKILIEHRETVALQEEGDPFFLRHLSPIRLNLIEWMPFFVDKDVLELYGSTGLLTSFFCSRVKKVVSVVESAEEGFLNRVRNADFGNLVVCAPPFDAAFEGEFRNRQILELPDTSSAFDVCTMIGCGGSDFSDLLRLAYRSLRVDGRLVLALNNRLGLQYFAGQTDDVSPRLFSGIEGEGAGFSKPDITTKLLEAGFADLYFYYPVPDFVYPTLIFSEDHLPKPGDIRPTSAHYDHNRYQFFDEKKAFDAICADGLFEVFANSFLITARKKEPADG